MATLQPSERAIRDLQSGTLSAEAFDQQYGIGASKEYLQLSQPVTEETEEVKEEEKRGLIADTAVGVAEGVRAGINAFGEATQELEKATVAVETAETSKARLDASIELKKATARVEAINYLS